MAVFVLGLCLPIVAVTADPPQSLVASASEPAERIRPQIQAIPKPTARQIVNALPYTLYVVGPAKIAWYAVTWDHGWSKEMQDAWWPFADNVMYGESGYCPNRLRGDVMVYPTDGCRQVRQGYGSDAGFAQLISVHYGPGKWLCVEHGICDKWTIISEPWISMEVFVWLLEREGSQPWCYSPAARRYHNCTLAPD